MNHARRASALLGAGLLSVGLSACEVEAPDSGSPVEDVAEVSDALTNVCPNQSVPGIDIASFQHPGGAAIDWSKVAKSNKFVIIKATEDDDYTNAYYAGDAAKARAAGLIVGSYHFLAPKSKTGHSGAAQAQYFLSKASIKKGDLPPMLDVETSTLYGGTLPSVSDVMDWLNKVESATGRKPLVYIGYYTLQALGFPSQLKSYPINIPNYSSCPSYPSGWPTKNLVMWQNTSSKHVDGIVGNVDSDKFYGSFADLQALAGANDKDNDGIPDDADNCPNTANHAQTDTDHDHKGDACDGDDDGDGVKDAEDDCPKDANPDQKNTDGDAKGDKCDPDNDNDKIDDAKDNCPNVPNHAQTDTDHDGKGDACDGDIDGDGVPNGTDNCPKVKNAGQNDTNGDGKGDLCQVDDDGDGFPDETDDCPKIADPDQADADGDGKGDACDDDADGDGVPNSTDNCALVANVDQADLDADGVGDACADDVDGDGIPNGEDVCPLLVTANQSDADDDGQGDACDADLDGDGIPNDEDSCEDPNGACDPPATSGVGGAAAVGAGGGEPSADGSSTVPNVTCSMSVGGSEGTAFAGLFCLIGVALPRRRRFARNRGSC